MTKAKRRMITTTKIGIHPILESTSTFSDADSVVCVASSVFTDEAEADSCDCSALVSFLSDALFFSANSSMIRDIRFMSAAIWKNFT